MNLTSDIYACHHIGSAIASAIINETDARHRRFRLRGLACRPPAARTRPPGPRARPHLQHTFPNSTSNASRAICAIPPLSRAPSPAAASSSMSPPITGSGRTPRRALSIERRWHAQHARPPPEPRASSASSTPAPSAASASPEGGIGDETQPVSLARNGRRLQTFQIHGRTGRLWNSRATDFPS